MPRAVAENKTSAVKKPRTRRTVSRAPASGTVSTTSPTRTRKAPTKVSEKPERGKLRRPPKKLLINGGIIFTGFILSAWIGYSAPASINVNAKIAEQNVQIAEENEERVERGEVTQAEIPKQNTNPLPNGGLVGRGPAPSRPAPAPAPVVVATTTASTTENATSTQTTADEESGTDTEVSENGAVDTVKAEVDVGSEETEAEPESSTADEEAVDVSEENSTPPIEESVETTSIAE